MCNSAEAMIANENGSCNHWCDDASNALLPDGLVGRQMPSN